MKKWLCVVCGLIYDEAQGWPKDGIEPGTRWEDVPDDWKCPDCGVGKAEFEMIEISASPAPATPAVTAAVPSAPSLPTRGPLVIVGSGHAGYSLARAVRQFDPGAEIVLISRESGHLYAKPALSVATSQGRSSADLIDESPFEIEQRLKLRIYPHCEVRAIDPQAHVLHTGYGPIRYGRLVLALGASPIRLDVAGRSDAMLSVNNLDDYAALQRQLSLGARVAIVGDGLIGCEFADDLAAAGFAVSVIGIGKWPLERLLPEQAGAHLRQALAARGVEWRLQNSVKAISGEPGAWTLSLADGDEIEASVVISAVGLAPNVALAADCGADVGRGIRTDAQLRSSLPDIFALGDCIEIDGRPAPYLAPINHGVEALARTLTGQPTEVRYPPMPVQVKTPSAPLSLLPPPAGVTGEWRNARTEDGFSCAYIDDTGRMRGFALIGQQAQTLRREWVQECGLRVTREMA